jgi:3-deoxy-D-manno-octulosonate 8-phosphate phosphatase (KDO 8-P phosphatase)
MQKKNLTTKLKKIRMVLLDVDGVLTDGRISIGNVGLAITEMKFFDSHDGFGIKRAIDLGLRIGILTGRRSELVESRARELGITDIYQGLEDKMSAYDDVKNYAGVRDDEICYIGDDIPDLPVLSKVGFSAAPAGAMADILAEVDYIAKKDGGRGAVREILDMILKAQKKIG